ncbi:MAG: DUF1330 domain-containing protein [Betaproteobacteria bacterium]|jgi:uncharacterized protein (DUF1330 family)|nr:DUF1330 domain-containing protein [Burkholderiales bacterium]NBX89096.1 DUF1330 domain-containing protein [Betaproteobacteria bacterium]
MTKAYLIGQVSVTNPEGYAQYAQNAPATIEKYGGKYIVRGGHTSQLCGAHRLD